MVKVDDVPMSISRCSWSDKSSIIDDDDLFGFLQMTIAAAAGVCRAKTSCLR